MSEHKTFYITTPIYDPSDKLHIGHSYTTAVSYTHLEVYKRQHHGGLAGQCILDAGIDEIDLIQLAGLETVSYTHLTLLAHKMQEQRRIR